MVYNKDKDTNTNLNDTSKIEFLNRLFLNRIYPDDDTPRLKRNLSGLSYRLAWLLYQELDFNKPDKLPAIKNMAEKLSTTTASIHDSLAQLEMAGIIIRSTEASRIVHINENDQIESNRQFLEYKNKEIERKSFKDYFILNLYCNMKKEDILTQSIDLVLDEMLSIPLIFNLLYSKENYKDIIYAQLIESQIITDDLKGSKDETYKFVSNYIDKYIKIILIKHSQYYNKK